MQKSKTLTFTVAILVLIQLCIIPGIYAQDTLLQIIKEEMNREMTVLKKQEIPPYYIEYRINELYTANISTSFGSLISSNENRGRILTTTVKIGNYKLDNSHEIKGTQKPQRQVFASAIPFENDPDAIKQIIWYSTDKAYKNAASSYTSIINNISDVEDNNVSDFSIEEPVKYYDPPFSKEELSFNRKEWEQKLKSYSLSFLENDSIFVGEANINYTAERKYFITTEGSEIIQNQTYARFYIDGRIKSDDGNVLPLYKSYFAFKPTDLPSDESIMADIKELIKKLKELKNSVIAEPYTGPAILSPSASGVFFHEIFGHRIEGQRLKSDTDGQTFKKKVGKKLLPKFMNIVFDPSLSEFQGQNLNGHYKYDDQGVKGEKVTIIDKGILRNFLMSRCPIENFSNSNGHGRAQAGAGVVTRQSNLMVETEKPLTEKDLRKMLINECKKQGKEYGYYFKKVIGGFTITNRYTPNVFNIMPTEVYRIYVDGRSDELVRGVDLIGTPLSMFSKIKATGDTKDIFTGTCGAESGNIPVTAISPALFVEQIETQKIPESYEELPILPRPDSIKAK